MRIHDDELILSPKAKDPHHDGFSEWCFHNGVLYHRSGIKQWWTKVNKVSFTPARVRLIARLCDE